MKIAISITDTTAPVSVDIMVNDEQKIETTFNVLEESVPELSGISNIKKVRLKENGRIIATSFTYKDANIYNGAELLLMRN